jgi:hypothetical protein
VSDTSSAVEVGSGRPLSPHSSAACFMS